MYSIRGAGTGDLPQLLAIAERFIDESGQQLTFDAVNTRQTLEAVMDHEDCCIRIVLAPDDQVVGVYILQTESPFSIEKWGYVPILYVRPDHRRSAPNMQCMVPLVSEVIAEDIRLQLLGFGVKYAFVSSTALIAAQVDSALIQLLRKHGFKRRGGPVLVYESQE